MLQITAAIRLPKHTVVGSKRYVKMPKKNTTLMGGVFFGASSRTRTYDHAVNSRMLYRLSY